ncbi:MAG: hypothetical protein ABIR78_06440, partial [Ferruginibacter sp.]
YINIGKSSKQTIQLSGITAMAVVLFLFTKFHDTIINVAGFFGVIALTLTLFGLCKNKWTALFYFGIFNLLLIGLNNYCYHTKELMIYLPVVQALSFASFLTWFCCINIKMYRK